MNKTKVRRLRVEYKFVDVKGASPEDIGLSDEEVIRQFEYLGCSDSVI